MNITRSTLALLTAAAFTHSAAAPVVGGCQIFPSNHIFNTRIDSLPTHLDSAAFIKRISANYSGTTFTGLSTKLVHLDLGTQASMLPMDTYYGIPYNVASSTSNAALWKRVYFQYNGVDPLDGYPDESECAVQTSPGVFTPIYPCTPAAGTPTYMPILPIGSATGGAGELKIEGGVPFASAAGDPSDPATAYDEYGDHHILTIDTGNCTLWEAYHAYPLNGSSSTSDWEVLSIARFDLNSNALRPAGITSADAAGLPIFPLLLRADEANAGPDGIQHPLRFTLLGSKVRGEYVWPARHKTGSAPADGSADDDGLRPPMGQLFRLPANFDITTVPGWPAGQVPNAQTVAVVNALKRYGMYLADNGSNMYIQGEPSSLWLSQTFSQLQRIPHTAFEAVDLSPIMARAGFNINSAAVPAAATAVSPLHDLNDDGKSDIVWRNGSTGANWYWALNGTTIVAQGAITTLPLDWQIQSTAVDFDGDGKSDILLRNMTTGQPWVWFMNGNSIIGGGALPTLSDMNWIIAGTGDLNGDGKGDVVWRNTSTGQNWWWALNGTSIINQGQITALPPEWVIQSTLGDFNGDGKTDILWRNMTTGQPWVWMMDGNNLIANGPLPTLSDLSWIIAGTGDLNGDGKHDVVWRNTSTGANWYWALNGTTITTQGPITTLPTDWQIQCTSADFDGDGKADILLRNMTTGQPWVWFMNGNTILSGGPLPTLSDMNWQIKIHN